MHRELEKASLESSVTFAGIVLKSVFLVNGGAAISLLTFMGNTSQRYDVVLELTTALQFFSAGVVFSLLASFSAYFTQLLITHRIGAEAYMFEANEKAQLLVAECKHQQAEFWLAREQEFEARANKHYRQENILLVTSSIIVLCGLVSFCFGAFIAGNALAI